ncbi:LOG family protein [Enterococcus casseliflavus]|uniref:LOG family protein n=1 Tax=Enterococcus casseliflavus TaxID=37734 RepID=UPI0001B6D6B2|nr:LOG family protein [Enterococcus casseliflavus]EEV28431.1 lysine decarboxylase [Enterococcus casseliflavus EC30]EEV34766.1 lysine decarboxylase [Enterococcus casseliflavus EC10]
MRVTVYCGTRLENAEKLAKTARAIGNALAKNHIELVYCGPLAGLMREIVKGVFEKEGAVTGIYPSGYFAEDLPPIITGSSTYTEFYTDTREEQTQQLLEMSDAYLVLPGGFGTLEELSSVCSFMTLGKLPVKPIGVLMNEGLKDGLKPLLTMFEASSFAWAELSETLFVLSDVETLIQRLAAKGSKKECLAG